MINNNISQKLDVAEINYKIHDNELLAILDSGSLHQIIVYKDWRNQHILFTMIKYWVNVKLVERNS